MLTQSEILALKPQIEKKLPSLVTDLEKVTTEINNTTDFSSEKYIDISKQQRALQIKIEGLEKLKSQLDAYNEANTILSGGTTDNDLISLAQEEMKELPRQIQELYDKHLSETSKFQNVIMEIRAGAGGEEASLFAAELFRMYSQFGAEQGWKISLTNREMSEKGGFKHLSAFIEGDNAYHLLQHESGVHRVQRVPETESSGRIHTSTVSVAILPEVEDLDFEIDEKDIVMEAFRASGPGGQFVNKTSSAVRLTHVPTGVVVASQEQRSQLKNRQFAMKMIKSRIYQAQLEAQQKELGDLRRSQIGSGGRSEKIRTYNFPQSRVTDHRVKKSWFNLTDIMDGKLETVLNDVRQLLQEQENDEKKD